MADVERGARVAGPGNGDGMKRRWGDAPPKWRTDGAVPKGERKYEGRGDDGRSGRSGDPEDVVTKRQE